MFLLDRLNMICTTQKEKAQQARKENLERRRKRRREKRRGNGPNLKLRKRKRMTLIMLKTKILSSLIKLYFFCYSTMIIGKFPKITYFEENQLSSSDSSVSSSLPLSLGS